MPLADLLGLAHAEAAAEHLLELLEAETRRLGVAAEDEDEAQDADTGVQRKGGGGSNRVHHGQERRRDDNVGGPDATGENRGAETTELEREELGDGPGDVTTAGRVECNEDDCRGCQ